MGEIVSLIRNNNFLQGKQCFPIGIQFSCFKVFLTTHGVRTIQFILSILST